LIKPSADSLPPLRHCIPFISFISLFLYLTDFFPTIAAEYLVACAPLRDFVHLVSDPPRMLGSTLCRVECCWQGEKLVSPRVNGEFHTVH
ncbi:hypothetical protein L218DRAFT_967960, partial [Marasmius fiardii PR-910]